MRDPLERGTLCRRGNCSVGMDSYANRAEGRPTCCLLLCMTGAVVAAVDAVQANRRRLPSDWENRGVRELMLTTVMPSTEVNTRASFHCLFLSAHDPTLACCRWRLGRRRRAARRPRQPQQPVAAAHHLPAVCLPRQLHRPFLLHGLAHDGEGAACSKAGRSGQGRAGQGRAQERRSDQRLSQAGWAAWQHYNAGGPHLQTDLQPTQGDFLWILRLKTNHFEGIQAVLTQVCLGAPPGVLPLHPAPGRQGRRKAFRRSVKQAQQAALATRTTPNGNPQMLQEAQCTIEQPPAGPVNPHIAGPPSPLASSPLQPMHLSLMSETLKGRRLASRQATRASSNRFCTLQQQAGRRSRAAA